MPLRSTLADVHDRRRTRDASEVAVACPEIEVDEIGSDQPAILARFAINHESKFEITNVIAGTHTDICAPSSPWTKADIDLG